MVSSTQLRLWSLSSPCQWRKVKCS
ncbi:MAG: hypothetical protein HN982_04680 [Candidatus Marinimicrobia bacterium]|nr:hypothetical protein [Candidatus Neomarinimicrobiota bacterium]